jgi:hypothetical protein
MRKAVVFLGLLALMGTAGWAFAGSPEGGRPPGPLPEAFKVCEGKNPGDTVQIQTPRRDTISATCRLVAVPHK